MTDRLPWFRCFPSALLGAVAGMGADEGYTYIAVLLRIYETGGPVADTARTLARRTGLTERRVAAALESLTAAGKLSRCEDGRLDSPSTHDELDWQKCRKVDQSSAGKASAAKRSKITERCSGIRRLKISEQNQQTNQTAVQQSFNHLDKDLDTSLRLVTRAECASNSDFPPNAFAVWYEGYPHKVAKQAAQKSFDRIRKAGNVTFAELVNGRDRYVANKPARLEWCNPASWLNQGRWADEPAAGSGTGVTATTTSTPKTPIPDAMWDKAIERYKTSKQWLFSRDSAPPDDPATTIPSHILIAHGYGEAAVAFVEPSKMEVRAPV